MLGNTCSALLLWFCDKIPWFQQILLATDVRAMMVLDEHGPGIDWLLEHPGLDLAGARKGFARSESSQKHMLCSRIARIRVKETASAHIALRKFAGLASSAFIASISVTFR